MKKIILEIVLILCIIAEIKGEQVYIGPLVYIMEGEEERYEEDEKVREEIYERLEEEKDYLGIQIIKTGKEITRVRSSYEALKVCKEEGIKYLIYGWIKKGLYTYEGEIRIYDGEGRKNIGTVYGKEAIEEYEKFIKNISIKLEEKLREIFYIPKKEEIKKRSMINIESAIQYWTFMGKGWVKYMSGTVGVGVGFEVIPDDKVFFIKKEAVYIPIGLIMDYKLGVNRKEGVKGYLNSINWTVYSGMNVKIYERHIVYIKTGVMYNLDILDYKDKYSDWKKEVTGAVGIVSGVGYKYCINEKVKMTMGNEFEAIFYNKVMSKSVLKVGIEVEVYNKEHIKK
ncbi:hypothetical protein [Treponema pedis]|uniref:Uncharacterized protein n=1 Tax=Treponema pedis TaxID=409322 RepID=A0A7S6WRE1_9SPIR|nr:hypothetical protein [Treponema pedis]QOW61617.1 hypothetical protein IFE08_04320 [Treponema pedis]QOW61905.1 hypothetical protein IFE08_05995 [Treponema pedis]